MSELKTTHEKKDLLDVFDAWYTENQGFLETMREARFVAASAWKTALEARRLADQAKAEPFGCVTVRRLSQRHENHADQFTFYPAGQSPYLDNVDECHTVYTAHQPAAQPVAVPDVEAAAKKLAEVFDYPWEHMTEKGRQQMRENARQVLLSAAPKVQQ